MLQPNYFKILAENGVMGVLIIFIILVLGFLIKWLVSHVDKILKDANEDKSTFNKIIEKQNNTIENLARQIETSIKNNEEAHRMQKMEHASFQAFLQQKRVYKDD